MDDGTIDLLDHRGRITRLAIAAVIALVVTIVGLGAIQSIARTPNPDPMSKISVVLMGIGMFVATTYAIQAILARVVRRR